MVGPRQWLVLMIMASSVLAACQAAPTAPDPGVTASPATTSPRTSASPAASPSTDLGEPTQPAEKKVLVTSSASAYPARAPIVIVVVNGLDRTVFAEDAQTDCSILILQRQEGDRWTDVVACAQQRPPATVAIGPAHARTVTLRPDSINVQTAGKPTGLPPGTYRAAYRYWLSVEQAEPASQEATSEPFDVG